MGASDHRRTEPHPKAASDASETRILARWIAGLRWSVFLALAVTLPLDGHLFGFSVNYPVALGAIAFALAKDVATKTLSWGRRPPPDRAPTPRLLALGVAIDLVAMAAVLAASGGAANPMSALFFVHVALAASLLPPRSAFLLAGLAAASFGALFLLPSGACCANHAETGTFSAHLYGMLLAFTLGSALVSFFLTRVRRALADRAHEIADLRRRAEETTRFAALGTLAAGTAHELATPLGTIAVLAGEIDGASTADAKSHAASILAQVSRCRDVITKMHGGAREAAKSPSTDVVSAAMRAIDLWRAAHPSAAIDVRADPSRELRVQLASDEIESALSALLDNAHFATLGAGSAAPIAVIVRGGGDEDVRVEVEDQGTGVAPELVSRLGEPFLTTKQPGEGMGLGLYLVRRILDECGGRLEVLRRPQGTRVSLHLRQLPAAGGALP